MDTIVVPIDPSLAAERAVRSVPRVAHDVWLLAGRNIRKVLQNPRLIVFSTVQPVMQLVLFVFVFGSVVNIQGLSFKEFVVPAVIIQTMVFTGMQSGIGIAQDLHTGMIDRFRSLPIARSTFLLGRMAADTARLAFQAGMLVVTALLIGFHFRAGLAGAAGMIVIVILWGMALNTFSAFVGLTVKDPETTQAAVFLPLLPLIFTSSAFAPISRLPGWMQPVARVNPVTSAIDLARGLALGGGTLQRISNVSLAGALGRFAVAWAVIIGLSTTFAVRRYARA
jgi:ABC-2 type transport system permease protein/oleandomycin transport system permease protein